MSFVTIVLFFIYSWGFGFTFTSFLKNSENFLERNLMRIGIGIGIISIFSVFLNLIKVPLDWKIFLFLSLIVPIIYLIRNFKKIEIKNHFKLTKSNIFIVIVLVMFAFLLFMNLKGSFGYPWLEDGDPWEYATTAKYIAIHKTFSKPADMDWFDYNVAHYMEPYPIGYSVIMGILHQTSPSVKWTLKFFNALLVSLSVIFFYFFVKEFSRNRNIALAAAFVLTVIPCFLGHFIFSQVLGLILFFPALYALDRIKYDKKWTFVAIIIIASIMISQLLTAAVFGTLFFTTYLIINFFGKKRLWKYVFLAGFFGLVLSFIYWGPMLSKYSLDGIKFQNAIGKQTLYKVGGGDLYNLGDFIYAKGFGNSLFSVKWANAIDNPIGMGWFLSLLLIFTVILILIQYKKLVTKENRWLFISFLWLFLTFINIHSGRLPVGFVPHRSWSFFAIPVSIIVGYGIIILVNLLKNFKVNKIIIIVILVIVLVITSGYPKYVVNTALWPQHKFIPDPNGELGGYLWLENLPINTMVTSLCRADHEVIALDKMSTAQWDRKQIDFKFQLINKSSKEISNFLRENKYQYAIIDSKCIERFGLNETNNKLNEMVSSGLFQPVLPQNIKGIVVFKLS